MINITKDTIIGDILDVAPQTAPHGPRHRRGQAAGSGERGSQQGSVIAPHDRTHTGIPYAS